MRSLAPVFLFASRWPPKVRAAWPNLGCEPDVLVTVYTRQAVLYEATSDSGGTFQIFGIKPGDYEVRFGLWLSGPDDRGREQPVRRAGTRQRST